MFKHLEKNNEVRKRRTLRVRRKIHGTATRPRLAVVKTNKHILAQLIDDDAHHTIGSFSTLSKDIRQTEFNRKSKVAARKIGEEIAKIAVSKNIKEVIFDRGPSKYHGILAELANGARENGLTF